MQLGKKKKKDHLLAILSLAIHVIYVHHILPLSVQMQGTPPSTHPLVNDASQTFFLLLIKDLFEISL